MPLGILTPPVLLPRRLAGHPTERKPDGVPGHAQLPKFPHRLIAVLFDLAQSPGGLPHVVVSVAHLGVERRPPRRSQTSLAVQVPHNPNSVTRAGVRARLAPSHLGRIPRNSTCEKDPDPTSCRTPSDQRFCPGGKVVRSSDLGAAARPTRSPRGAALPERPSGHRLRRRLSRGSKPPQRPQSARTGPLRGSAPSASRRSMQPAPGDYSGARDRDPPRRTSGLATSRRLSPAALCVRVRLHTRVPGVWKPCRFRSHYTRGPAGARLVR